MTTTSNTTLDIITDEEIQARAERRSLTSKYNKVLIKKRRPSAGKSLSDWI